MTTLAQRVAQFPASTPEWEIADVLNAPDQAQHGTRRVDVPALEVRRVLLESQSMAQAGTNPWMKVRGFHAAGFAAAAASGAATAAVWVLCDELVEEVRREGTFGMSRPAMYAVMSASLDALTSAQLLAAGDKGTVLALAETPQSEAWAAGWGVVTPEAVSRAKGA
jgi:hypothetical protein